MSTSSYLVHYPQLQKGLIVEKNEYYEERLRRLTEAQDTKLRTLDDASKLRMEHEYFTGDYYSKMSTLTKD